MAVGDGWQRHLAVRLRDGTRAVVAFDDYDPLTMTPWEELGPISSRVEVARSELAAGKAMGSP
jgi:hypothetical protein